VEENVRPLGDCAMGDHARTQAGALHRRLAKLCDEPAVELRRKNAMLWTTLKTTKCWSGTYMRRNEGLQADLQDGFAGVYEWVWGSAKGLHTPCKPTHKTC